MALILPDDATSVSTAAMAVRNGRLVAYPTDTVYGLGCDPWSDDAVGRLFDAKGREAKPVPVLFADLSGVEATVRLNETSMGLARLHWPGPLTIVAPLRRAVPLRLDQGSGWLGVRIPDHPVARALARESGGSVTGTSANLSGHPSCATASEVQACLGDTLDVIIDGGTATGGQSTVVKVVGESVEVLRRGVIGIESGTVKESFNR